MYCAQTDSVISGYVCVFLSDCSKHNTQLSMFFLQRGTKKNSLKDVILNYCFIQISNWENNNVITLMLESPFRWFVWTVAIVFQLRMHSSTHEMPTQLYDSMCHLDTNKVNEVLLSRTSRTAPWQHNTLQHFTQLFIIKQTNVKHKPWPAKINTDS